MDSAQFNRGMQIIGEFFPRAYPQQSIEVIRKEAEKEAPKAMMRAIDRVFTEFLPAKQPPIAEILKIIQQEGKKLRQEESQKREEDWNREKGADSNGRVNGDPIGRAAKLTEEGKGARQIINAILDDKPKDKIVEAMRMMGDRFPHSEWAKMARHYDLHGGLELCMLGDRR